MTNEDVGEGQPDQASEMDHLHVAVRDDMTFIEYYGLKTKGGHRRKRYCLKDRLDGETCDVFTHRSIANGDPLLFRPSRSFGFRFRGLFVAVSSVILSL